MTFDATDCPAVGTSVGESTTTPETKPGSALPSWARIAVGALLGLALLVSIGWIVLGWPLPVRLWILLAVVAGSSLTGLVALFIREVHPRLRQGLVAGSTLIAVLAAMMAVPALQGAAAPATGKGGQETPGPSESPTLAASQPSTEPDPLTASLSFDEPCEDFSVPKSLIPSLPKPDPGYDSGLDARWVYDHGGATAGGSPVSITVQGKTEDAVLIRHLRIVDLKRNPAPSNAVYVLKCGPVGGDAGPRYFEVNMSDPAKITPRPAPYANEDGKRQPAIKFPIKLKVSNSDLELLVFKVTGPDCFCEWRLAIDWTSGGRSGTTIIDHGFAKIRSDTRQNTQRPVFTPGDGKWEELK
jgi:hypothetical protein